jgi:hypothetical protein
MKRIQWPLVNAENELYLAPEWRADDCLIFHTDGTIESNGGPVGHHKITDEQIDILPEPDQKFVREFLDGDYSLARELEPETDRKEVKNLFNEE